VARAAPRSTRCAAGRLISFASRGTEVRTGDVIGSGTVGSDCILELAIAVGTGPALAVPRASFAPIGRR
jgi:hypothetical protein